MKRFLAVLGLTAVLCTVVLGAPRVANAAPSKELRARISVMLSAPEYTPSEKEWTALGPDAAIVLREVALDEDVLVLKRGRAATVLAYFESASTRAALEKLAADEASGWLLRGKAAHSLARAYGEGSLDAIAPLLSADEKRMREAAIKAVGIVKGVKSRTLLESRLKAEKSTYLRKVITKVLARREDSK